MKLSVRLSGLASLRTAAQARLEALLRAHMQRTAPPADTTHASRALNPSASPPPSERGENELQRDLR